MKVKDLVAKLQLLDQNIDALVQAPDGGEHYAVTHVAVDEWDDGETIEPIALIVLAL